MPPSSRPACPALPSAVRLLQEKWVLPIVWSLMREERGFNDLARTLGAIGPTTLAGRLDRLEGLGLVARTVHSVSPPRTSYALTPSGQALSSVFEAVGAWCADHADAPPHDAGACDAPDPNFEPPVVRILAALQEKWTLPIIGQLEGGAKGFNELARLVGVNVTTLGSRLSRLEALGLVTKTVLSEFPPRNSYELTAGGHAFRSVLSAITAWGEAHLPQEPS